MAGFEKNSNKKKGRVLDGLLEFNPSVRTSRRSFSEGFGGEKMDEGFEFASPSIRMGIKSSSTSCTNDRER